MNTALSVLTKLQIRFLGGKYARTQIVSLPEGREQEIVVYTGDKCLFSGQCTLFRTIIIKDSVLQNPDLFNYVFTHEMAHKKQWWGIFVYPLLILAIASFSPLVGALLSLTRAIIFLNPVYLMDFLLGFILATVLFIIPWAFSWLMEINADFKAINAVGLQTYLNIFGVLPKSSPTFIQKIIIRLTHPPYRFTAYLWKRFHKEAAAQFKMVIKIE